MGYRKLLNDKKLLVGTNAFWDHQLDQRHNRMSVGAEARTSLVGVTVNRYQALSNWKTIDQLYESRGGSTNSDGAVSGISA